MNTWTEIKIAVNAADIDKAGDIANVVVPYGIYIEDYTNLEQVVEDIAHIDLIDEELLRKDRSRAYVHIYLNRTFRLRRRSLLSASVTVRKDLRMRWSCSTAPRRTGATTGRNILHRSPSEKS